jgi:hypothetical protein
MKSLRFTLIAVVLALPLAAVAQENDPHHHGDAQKQAASQAPAQGPAQTASQTAPQGPAQAASQTAPQKAPSEAQLSFKSLKALAGEWEGPVSTDMSAEMKKQMGAGTDRRPLHVTMRVTSRGNVLVHEFQEAGTPLDAKKYDHPVTMLYVDQDKLNLVHYCDAGNRPRMVAKVSPDGKTYDFDFADLSGGNNYGHMAHAKFTIVDENHHVEEWTYMLPNDMPIHARFELARVQGGMAVVAGGK